LAQFQPKQTDISCNPMTTSLCKVFALPGIQTSDLQATYYTTDG